jgi:hypothetical protein
MERKRRQGHRTPQGNNSMEDLVINDENGYPVPDSNKTMITVTNELSDAHKKSPKRNSWTKSLRNSWRNYKTQLTRKYKMHSRNIKTPQINTMRRHRND